MTKLGRPRCSLSLVLLPAAVLVLAAFAFLMIGESFFEGCEDHCADEGHDTCVCAHCANIPRIVEQPPSIETVDRGRSSRAHLPQAEIAEQVWVNAIDHPPQISC